MHKVGLCKCNGNGPEIHNNDNKYAQATCITLPRPGYITVRHNIGKIKIQYLSEKANY